MDATRLIRPLLLSTLALPLLAAGAAAQDVERFSIDARAVAVYNLVGAMRVEAGSGPNVVVEVRRGGDDAGRLEIARHEVNGRSALVIRYPDDEIVYGARRWGGSTSINVRSDGTFFGRGERGERVTIRSSGDGLEAWADVRILVPAGKDLDVRLGVGEVSASGVDGALDIDVAAASVETSRTRGRLRIDTGSGRVEVSDAEGNVLVDTGSGSVELEGVRGEELIVDTGSGSVSGAGLTAGMVRIDTGSGRISLNTLAARDVELDTGSGSVTVDLTTDVERLYVDTGSGSVRVTVPENLGASLTIDTGSGGIDVDVPVTVQRRNRSFLAGQLGDGRGSIEIDTGSGGVRITRR